MNAPNPAQHRPHRLRNAMASLAVALPPALLLGALLAALLPGPWSAAAPYALASLLPCLWLGAHIAPRLIARFDSALLQAPPGAPSSGCGSTHQNAAQHATWRALQSWCQAGMGSGRAPFWQPAQLPEVTERLRVAVLRAGRGTAVADLVNAFARHLDRDDELAALSARSRLQAWRLKLTVKWHELWWWRARHPRQPWDCGHLLQAPEAPQRLATFTPRRPTLIIARELTDDALAQVLQALRCAQSGYRHPVRLLILDGDARRWPPGTDALGPVTMIE